MIIDVHEIAAELRAALAIEPFRLDLVACAIARLDDEPFDAHAVQVTLDQWADRVHAAIGRPRPDPAEALAVILGGELGLRGDVDEYDHPRNSFLPRVLTRRRGLPILLSVVYLEVARRIDFDLFGLAWPRHFLVGYEPEPGELVVLDPFNGGARLSQDEIERFHDSIGRPFDPDFVELATPEQIAVRMLTNLSGSYARRERWDRVRAAEALIEVVRGGDVSEASGGRSPGVRDEELN